MNKITRNKIKMLIREELHKLVELSTKFDADKVRKLVDRDKFLNYEWKKIKNRYRGSKEEKGLEYFYNLYVDGDSQLEKQYKKIR